LKERAQKLRQDFQCRHFRQRAESVHTAP
jgi:hypothetical protein